MTTNLYFETQTGIRFVEHERWISSLIAYSRGTLENFEVPHEWLKRDVLIKRRVHLFILNDMIFSCFSLNDVKKRYFLPPDMTKVLIQ